MKPLVRNISSLISGDMAVRMIGFAITVYLARVLSPDGFGMFGIGLAVLGHMQLIASPGVQFIETRNIAADANPMAVRIGGVLTIRITIATLLALVAGSLLPYLVSPPELASCILLSLLSLFPLALFVDWVLQGKEDFIPLSAARVGGYAAYAAAVFVLVRSFSDVLYAPMAFFIGNIVTAAALLARMSSRYGPPRIGWNPSLWKDIVVQNAPTGAALYFGQLVFNLPPLVIGYFLGTHETGLYTAATKLVFLLLMSDRALNAVLLPALTRVLADRPDDVPDLLTLMLKLIWLIGVPVALCGILLAPVAIGIVFGEAYSASTIVTQVLLVYVGLTLMSSIAVCTLIATKNEGAYVRTIITGSAVLTIAVLILTPIWGITGAAVGATVGEGVSVVLLARQALRVQPQVRSGLSLSGILVIVPLVLATVLLYAVSPFITVAAVLVLWVVLMVVTQAIDVNDRARLRALLL
jgi:O-antigen/teichoic acid export membrane protein